MRPPEPQRLPVGALEKGIAILTLLIESPGAWGIREMAASLNMPKSTVHRTLQTLKESGLVESAGSHKYTLGVELYRLSQLIGRRLTYLDVARSVMERAVAACNETLLLGVYNPAHHKMMFALKVDCDHPVRYVLDIGKLLHLHRGASGKCILAWLPEADLAAAIAAIRSEGEAVDERALSKELAEIRRRGYAFTRSQRISGAVGIAAPVFSTGGLLGDLVLTIPDFRYRETMEESLSGLVVQKAQQLSHLLGAGDKAGRLGLLEGGAP